MGDHAPLQMVQTRAWSGFHYSFLDAAGLPVGHFAFPNFGQARNARLKFHADGSTAGDIRLVLDGEHRVDFEYLTRDWNKDLRYRLLRGHEVLAQIEVRKVRGSRWPDITLQEGPLSARLARTGHGWRGAYELRELASGHTVGRLQEHALFTLKRRYDIEGDALPWPIKGFLGVVVTSLRL